MQNCDFDFMESLKLNWGVLNQSLVLISLCQEVDFVNDYESVTSVTFLLMNIFHSCSRLYCIELVKQEILRVNI